MSGSDSGPGSGAGRLVLLGEIATVHGVRGEVVVRAFTADPAAIGDYGPLTDEQRTRTFRLSVTRVTPKGVFARIDGIADRTAAEALRGTRLFVPRDRLPPPDEGEYYHADLIGLAVQGPDGVVLGRVIGIVDYGAGDLLEFARAGERRTELVPFNDDFVPLVDIAAGFVRILPPNFVEIEKPAGEADGADDSGAAGVRDPERR